MTYSVDQLYAKLERADAAGDTEAAKVIADEIRRSQAPQAAPNSNNSDFGRLISGQPKETDSTGRQLALGARDTVSGITDTLGIVGNPINYLYSKVTGTPYQTMTDAAGGLMDQAGLPRPQNSGERVVSDVGRALSGTALTMGAGAIPAGSRYASPVMNQLGTLLSSQPGLQAISAATGATAAGVARESGASPVVQTGIGLAGGFFPGAARYTAAAGTRGVLRGSEAGRQATEQGINDFRLNGVQPSVGQATGNRRTQGVESLLAGGPTSGGVMVRAAEKQATTLGQGLQDRANALYPNASAERAGRAIEKGVGDFTTQIKAQRTALYNKADSLIPPTTTLPLTNTQQALAKLTALTPGAESTTAALVNPKIAELAKNVSDDLLAARANNTGGLPYQAVKDIRTRIGDELSDFYLSADKPTAQYKLLYKALSQDMEDAAKRQGPAAEQAVKRANGYFKASADRLDTLERVVNKNGAPEKVYAAVMSGTQDGGTTLRKVMQSLPPDGQKAVTGAVLKRMGLATKGQQGAEGDKFSAQTFLTNWNGVSKEAKRALFDRHGPKFVADMDRIARVAERITTGSKVFANPSGTTNRAAAYTYAAGLGTSALTGQAGAFAGLVGSGIATNITARMMTNPKFVSWLARTTTLPAAALPSQVTLLSRIADQDNDPELKALADSLKAKP
jgi:hypothetical protein